MASPSTAPAHSEALYRAALFDAGEWLARRFPLAFLRALAGAIGRLYALTHPARVAVVEQNLKLLDAGANTAAARRVYAEFGQTMADYFHIGTRPAAEAMKIIARIDGAEHLRAAHEAGRGALIVTAHLGLFELGGLLLAEHGYSAAVLTYPEPSRALTEWRARFRARWKADTLEIGRDSFAFLHIAERLRRGQFIASLIDRPHPSDSTEVALPNGMARFSLGILLLAAHAGAPVIPATMVRRADGAYHAQIFAPIFVETLPSRVETVERAGARVVEALLPVLRARPEQWYQFVPLNPATP